LELVVFILALVAWVTSCELILATQRKVAVAVCQFLKTGIEAEMKSEEV
jgi:hypothetical protein